MLLEAVVANPANSTLAFCIGGSAGSAVAVLSVPLLVEVAEVKVARRVGQLGNRRHGWVLLVKKLGSLFHTLLVGRGAVNSIPPAELHTLVGFRVILAVAMLPRVIVL